MSSSPMGRQLAKCVTGLVSRALSGGAAPKPFLLQPIAGATVTRLTSTSQRCMGVGSHMSDNDPDAISYHKEKHLKGETADHIPNTPGWCEVLASDSEAVIKAERNVDETMTMQTLQDFTIHVVQQLHSDTPITKEESKAHDVSGTPAVQANLEHTRSQATGTSPV